jgi:uncharacterized protein
MDECTRCGACCFSESARHARVTGDDHARLGPDADRLVVFVGNQAFMRLAGEEGTRHCAALIIDPARGTFLCGVYDRRPSVCRELERGSGACEGERAAKGERAGRRLLLLRTRA